MISPAVPVRDLRIVRLDHQHLAELMALQSVVCQHLDRPELYFPVTASEMHDLVGPDGLCLGIQHGVQLVAFFGVQFMGDRPDNVGNDLGLPSHDLPYVAYFMAVNVLPQYRGRGLQRLLTRALFGLMHVDAPPGESTDADEVLRMFLATCPQVPLPEFRWLCSTVSPYNLASLHSFLSCGFRIAGLKPKYLGHMRYLMLRGRSCVALEESSATATAVPLHAYAAQTELLMRGKLGVRLERNPQNLHVHYI